MRSIPTPLEGVVLMDEKRMHDHHDVLKMKNKLFVNVLFKGNNKKKKTVSEPVRIRSYAHSHAENICLFPKRIVSAVTEK